MARRHMSTRDDMHSLISAFDNFILDCDGVLWADGAPFPSIGTALVSTSLQSCLVVSTALWELTVRHNFMYKKIF